ncbi:MAG: hypothetical protein EOM84_02440 [Sphingobacteriia bacterium]|nr:hypothetical protein [Sphingobacteriia bacterium]
MIATLQALFNALRATATSEARSLTRVLFFLVMSAYTMAAIQAVLGNNRQFMLILGILIIFLNAFQLFRISRLIRLTAVGEALELARIVPNQTGIISNRLIDTYWQIAVQLTVIISVFCITTPFMPLWRDWWIPIVWPTLFVFAGVALGSFGQRFFRLALTVEILALIFIVSTVMFPQISAQLRIGELSKRFLRTDIADDVNIIERTRQSQRDAEIKMNLSEISDWVEKNPNGKYPDEYSRFLESVKNGERKTLREIRFEILHPKISTPTVKKNGWEKVEEKVVDFSRVEVSSITPEQHIAKIPLPVSIGSGNYKIKLQGSYDFFLGGRWIEFPWQGNDRLVAFPDKKEFSELQNGAVVILKGGENITPMSEDGAVVNLSGKIDKMTIKINTFFKNKGEYIHPSGGFILRNSENKPLKIIIEKEV